MTNKELYNIVYTVVTRALKENIPNKGEDVMWEFAKKIPNPKSISNEMAGALSVSVSHSFGEIGLECFFYKKVLPSDMITFDSSIKDDLGWYVRHNYDGHATMDEEMSKLISTI